jgi:flagellar P-ring protein precursor FlgI
MDSATRLLAVAVLAAQTTLPAARLKELVSIEGVRDNQLLGYGLVVGLAGTGDRSQTIFPVQSLTNLLQKMGVTVSASALTVKNTAGVMVTATLPPYAQPGSHLDVTVGAMGDAANLQGGLLILTSLRAQNGEVYAVAQGSVITGGFAAASAGTGVVRNHPTAGRIPEGAIVERGAPSVNISTHMNLQLHDADFTTAARIAEVINKRFAPVSGGVAHAQNSALINVAIPSDFSGQSTEFISELENLSVDVDRPAKIVINERTGTIILGKEVRISPVAILHGNLSVEIQTRVKVSQPLPESGGTTQVIPEATVGVKEEKARNVVLQQGATVEELVRALTAIGSTARDVIAILQNLKAAGALEAELEVI